ncbi:stigma-specific STIG1-like protein 2 [Selaginella moellendorffii]|nr:stigma-specific STIG1-like protein 2 [Selaginella moellendorffii]|eukprot:XP_002990607.2 stigma-specific STIG1-like protein 2 [Selaginella moellendorffii]
MSSTSPSYLMILLLLTATLVCGDEFSDPPPSSSLHSPRNSRKLSPLLLGLMRGRGAVGSSVECSQGESGGTFCRAQALFAASGSSASCCNRRCVDVGVDLFHCGICNRRCQDGESCCRGFCVDLNTNRKNCGECGFKCPRDVQCQFGICGYAG